MKNQVSEKSNNTYASLLQTVINKFGLQEFILWKRDSNGYYYPIFSPNVEQLKQISFIKSFAQFHLHTIKLGGNAALSYQAKGAKSESEFLQYLEQNQDWFLSVFTAILAEAKDDLYNLFSQVLKESLHAKDERGFSRRILSSIIDFVPFADAGFFFLYDQKTKKLLIEEAIGYREESYRKTQLASGEAITGQAFETKQPLVYNGERQIRDAMKNMTSENYHYYVASTFEKEFPNATLAVPLVFENEALGVLTINSFKENGYFSDDLLPILVQLIDYVTLIYVNHLLMERQEKIKKELDITQKALRAEHTQLQRTSDLYNNLASLVSENKGITEMMNAIYKIIHTPISFFDELLMPMSSVGTTPHHVLPPDFLNLREIQYAISVKRWQHIKLKGQESILVIPVIGAETVIGFLCAWIHEGFYDGDRLLLEYSASMLGLELMKLRTIEETHRTLFGEMFEQLIEGKMNESVIKQAQNLGFSEKDFYAVLICEMGEDEQDHNLHFLKESWMKWIQQALKIFRIHGLVTQQGTRVIAFLSMPHAKGKQTAQQKLGEFTKFIETIPFDVRIGIGRFFEGFISVRKSYVDAQQCLNLLVKKGNGKVLRFADGGINRLLLNYDKQELELFVSDYLGPLLETEKDKELLHTLITYVHYNGDLGKVTKSLSIHHNTLYYRLKRIEEILGVSPTEHEDWFDITVACKIYNFLHR